MLNTIVKLFCEHYVCVPIQNNLIPSNPNTPGKKWPKLFNYCPDMYKVFIFVNCIFLKKNVMIRRWFSVKKIQLQQDNVKNGYTNKQTNVKPRSQFCK